VVWPFFATHSLVGSPAYHPEFLDGSSTTGVERDLAALRERAGPHPVEVGYYRWLQDTP